MTDSKQPSTVGASSANEAPALSNTQHTESSLSQPVSSTTGNHAPQPMILGVGPAASPPPRERIPSEIEDWQFPGWGTTQTLNVIPNASLSRGPPTDVHSTPYTPSRAASATISQRAPLTPSSPPPQPQPVTVRAVSGAGLPLSPSPPPGTDVAAESHTGDDMSERAPLIQSQGPSAAILPSHGYGTVSASPAVTPARVHVKAAQHANAPHESVRLGAVSYQQSAASPSSSPNMAPTRPEKKVAIIASVDGMDVPSESEAEAPLRSGPEAYGHELLRPLHEG